MKFLAVAAAFVATAAATPAPGTGYTGSAGWGYPGWGGGRWGGWGNRWGGGWGGGWGGDTNFQHGTNVCGAGNAVMCCNSATYERDFGSNNAMFSLMDNFPHRGLPGSGVYDQCNEMNLGSTDMLNDHCNNNVACCQSNTNGGVINVGTPCVAIGSLL